MLKGLPAACIITSYITVGVQEILRAQCGTYNVLKSLDVDYHLNTYLEKLVTLK